MLPRAGQGLLGLAGPAADAAPARPGEYGRWRRHGGRKLNSGLTKTRPRPLVCRHTGLSALPWHAADGARWSAAAWTGGTCDEAAAIAATAPDRRRRRQPAATLRRQARVGGRRRAWSIAFLVAAPLLAIAASGSSAPRAPGSMRAESTWQPVAAVLTQSAAAGLVGLDGEWDTSWVKAKWTAPDGAHEPRSGRRGAQRRAGQRLTVWVTPAGQLTPPSADERGGGRARGHRGDRRARPGWPCCCRLRRAPSG